MDAALRQWSQTPSWAKLTAFAAIPTAAGFLSARFIDSYRGWLALGPGGLPYNIGGYLVNILMTILVAKNETTSLAIYERPDKYAIGWKKATDEEKAKAQKSFLAGAPLPDRAAPRAKSIHYCAPQREKNAGEYIDPQVKDAYLKAYDKLAEKHSDAIEFGTSLLERRGKAVFLKETYTLPALIASCRREVAHVHESDISAHTLLSFADAKDVVAKGWGERHRATGTVIALGYHFLYTPRNLEEIDVFMRIMEAGIEFAKSNGKA